LNYFAHSFKDSNFVVYKSVFNYRNSYQKPQFRIRDKERGHADWYSIKETFVRVPEISSITCTQEMNGFCEMKGSSIDYISQVSVDGGQSWSPQAPTTLQVQPTQDGQKLVMIPILQNKKLLMVKLRDFPKGEGLFIGNFSFFNSVKRSKTLVSAGNVQTGTTNRMVQLSQISSEVESGLNSKKAARKKKN
jgi:hypothetical protein